MALKFISYKFFRRKRKEQAGGYSLSLVCCPACVTGRTYYINFRFPKILFVSHSFCPRSLLVYQFIVEKLKEFSSKNIYYKLLVILLILQTNLRCRVTRFYLDIKELLHTSKQPCTLLYLLVRMWIRFCRTNIYIYVKREPSLGFHVCLLKDESLFVVNKSIDAKPCKAISFSTLMF